MPHACSWKQTLAFKTCPRASCRRRFQSDRGVRNHLNHPNSTCWYWFQNFNQNHQQSSQPINISNAGHMEEEDDISFPDELNHMDSIQYSNDFDLSQAAGYFVEEFPGAGATYGQGFHLYSDISVNHTHAEQRQENPFCPFSCFTDWEVAHWLSQLNVPLYAIDEFFKLQYVSSSISVICFSYPHQTMPQVKDRPLSYHSAKSLWNLVEQLPGAPPWMSCSINVDGAISKRPLTLYYRNTLECFCYLFSNPFFANHMDFSPRRVWSDETHSCRVFNEMMTGEHAWNIQVIICTSLFHHCIVTQKHTFQYPGKYPAW